MMADNQLSDESSILPSFEAGASYWNQRYKKQTTFWDLGEVSPPLKMYIDQLDDKHLSILIPGCGSAYEAAYLLEQGFTNITLIDIAPILVKELQNTFADNKHINILLGDFFELKDTFDLIIEQTFFCALPPAIRPDYAKKMVELLNTGGKLVGVLFNRLFEQEGPPFGGLQEEYRELFEPYFEFKHFDLCYNSYPKRAGTEYFIDFLKKQPR